MNKEETSTKENKSNDTENNQIDKKMELELRKRI